MWASMIWSECSGPGPVRWSHHHAASRHPDIILWQRWPPPASVFYPHIIARVAALPSSWRISNILAYSFRDRNPSQEPRHHDESQFQAWCALCSGHIRHTGVIRVPLLPGTEPHYNDDSLLHGCFHISYFYLQPLPILYLSFKTLRYYVILRTIHMNCSIKDQFWLSFLNIFSP